MEAQRRLQRQDTFDLRDQIHSDDHQHLQAHAEATMNYADDEEHSVLEDDSEADDGEEYIEDDISSTLSIPNESIDFDMVYAFHSFAATVEGQANVVKGDSLYLMDDTNSYWWLVRVLKTQEVGYIPAENIETPFERLARLNKHRNIDVRTITLIRARH
jgi:SH3 domain